MTLNNTEMMDITRLKELDYMIRTGTPVPVTETRNDSMFQESDLYNDFYTIQELVEIGALDYLGQDQRHQLYLRPRYNFSVFVMKETRDLHCGEVVKMALTEEGRIEFEEWISGEGRSV